MLKMTSLNVLELYKSLIEAQTMFQVCLGGIVEK